MSMASSSYADYATLMKDRWAKKLREAIESGDLEKVSAVVDEIEAFLFCE